MRSILQDAKWQDQCTYTIVMTDSWGDGWGGATMTLSQNGVALAVVGPDFTSGEGPVSVDVAVCDGVPIQLFWIPEGLIQEK